MTDEGSGAKGEPVHCNECEAQVILKLKPQLDATDPQYRLTCHCENTAVNINEVAAESLLFTPITGRWSQLNDP